MEEELTWNTDNCGNQASYDETRRALIPQKRRERSTYRSGNDWMRCGPERDVRETPASSSQVSTIEKVGWVTSVRLDGSGVHSGRSAVKEQRVGMYHRPRPTRGVKDRWL